MTTDTDLRDRLRDLADDAPPGALSGADLWRSGVRRQRRRAAGAVAAVAAAVAVVAGVGSAVELPRTAPPPADGRAEPGIPQEVRAPDPWSEPTRTPGPLSALSSAMHSRPDGMTDSRSRMMLFGVSAADGVARFLDLPGRPVNMDPASVALSPDGTRVAMLRAGRSGRQVVVRGWDVLDTTTGELTRLRVPGTRELRAAWGYEIAFTGDGSYLKTNFSLTDSDDSWADSLVAWDLETREMHVAEGPGHYWIPGRATGPGGVVWTRQRDVLTFDPVTWETAAVRVPHQLVDAAFSPDGGTLAYIGHEGEKPSTTAPWRLHVRDADGQVRSLDVGIDPGQVLGWRDEEHVVVSRYGPREARVVDVVTGDWEPLPLGQGEDTLMSPTYATDLLARDVAAPVDQPVVGDPRPWMWAWVRWTAASGVALLLAIWMWRRRGRA